MQISYKPKTQSSLNLPRQSFASVSKSSLFSADIDVKPISFNLKEKENYPQALNKSSGLTAAEVIKLNRQKKEALKVSLNAERSTVKNLRETVAVLKKDLNAAKEKTDAAKKSADAAEEMADAAKERADAAKERADAAKEKADAESKARTDAENRIEALLIELEKYRAAEKRKSESDAQSSPSTGFPDKKQKV